MYQDKMSLNKANKEHETFYPRTLKQIYKILKSKLKNISHTLPLYFFVLGFLFDVLTLGEVDNLISIVQQCTYIILAGLLLRASFLEQEGLWNPSEKIQKYWKYQNELVHFFIGRLTQCLHPFLFCKLLYSCVFVVFVDDVCLVNSQRISSCKKNKDWFFKYLLYAICLFSFFLFLLPLLAGTVSALAFIAALVVSSLLTLLNYRDLTQPLWIENPKVVKRTESPKSSRQAVILSEAKNLAL